jgi:hypothetical protein
MTDVQEAKATIEKKDKARFMEQVKAYKILHVQKREGKPLEVVSARCAEGSGELLVQSALKILEALKAQTPSRK